MAPNGRTTSVKFYGDPRAEARRDAAGIARKCQTQKPTEAPSEGDRVLLRTKPREKMDEVLALKARYTMHKWKKDGSSYFPLTNGEHQDGKKDGADKKGTGKSLAEEGGKPSCNLKSLLDNYPEAAQKEAFAPPSRVALENKEDGTKVLDKADLVDAVSNILMQMPPENILESSAAISMLARKLVDGQDSAIDSSFSQKFLLMSQIQVEVQRRLKEARSYIEELDSMEKVSNPKAPVRRRASSIANLLKALHGEKVGPPPSKTEQVANQMRTIRRLLQSLHWPNLHHEFLRWVRNSSGYETTVREFIRNVEDIFDHRPDIDHSRDDVCESITKHELRLTKSLRRYQLQMRNTGEDLARGEMKERKDAKEKERQRKLDLALERKASAKRAEIRRISLRRLLDALEDSTHKIDAAVRGVEAMTTAKPLPVQILEYRTEYLDPEYQGWILIFATMTCAWCFCLPCFCAGMSSPHARKFASRISQHLPMFYLFMVIFNATFMFLVLQWLPNWDAASYVAVCVKSAAWLASHVLKWATSLAMIVAFCFVVAFKERIALMLGLDHKQIFNCKMRDCLSCFSTARFTPIELLIWKVEDLPSADIFHANNVFIEAYLGYNETMRTRVHNNAGSDCFLKESIQLNFDQDDDEEKLFLFVQNQKVVGAQELARVEISSDDVKKILKDGHDKGASSSKWSKEFFPYSFPLIPRGQVWVTAVPVVEEHHGYAELARC